MFICILVTQLSSLYESVWLFIIIEWPGLKRTTMIIEFQHPCYVQGRQSPDQAAQSHVQLGLECLQGWGIHNVLGQPVPVCHHPLCEKYRLQAILSCFGNKLHRQLCYSKPILWNPVSD